MSDNVWSSALAIATAFATLGLSVGCNESATIAPFTGTVTYNGKPLEFGSVTFQPAAGGAIARAQIQPDGTFELTTDGRTGAPIGMNNVRVTCFANQKPGAAQAGDGEASLGKALIPERYSRFSSSGLTIEVKAGENPPYEIELSD
ncbi:hypothetical protein [Aeoliella sp.]|uniref:hypothetical protein n=1 Tax=Aeoliella sp. TaxID=2795800 RepID=UPI003CCBCE75